MDDEEALQAYKYLDDMMKRYKDLGARDIYDEILMPSGAGDALGQQCCLIEQVREERKKSARLTADHAYDHQSTSSDVLFVCPKGA